MFQGNKAGGYGPNFASDVKSLSLVNLTSVINKVGRSL